MKLIERKEIFETHKNIASLIKGFQKVFFDEEYDTEDDEMFDALKLDIDKIKNTGFSLMLQHNDINSYSKKLSEKLTALLSYLRVENLILLSHLKIDFFGNLEHDYEKVINAYSLLSEITNSKSFKETIETKVTEIENLVEILFWLERCDGSIPEYIFWADENERFCFYFCKYGNIHFIDFTNGNLISEKELSDLGFIVNEDYDQFSENSIIDNRQIKL
ncbi:hypothetical protein [Empedobacter falsenii]|uniref:hypothetical protein n=1 Tax=Empedobacter falsenii TaxID=343874 RepID=UPI003A7F9228